MITEGSGWKLADEASQLGWEVKFNKDFNGDGVTGIPSITDADNNGLVDSVKIYQIFNKGKAITLTSSLGDTYSDDFTPFWNATAATSYGSGYQVLLEGKTTFEGQYYILDTDASGVITGGSGWKTGAEASQLNWESNFNKDLNGDGTIPVVKDDDTNGLVDNVANYSIFNNGKAITVTSTAGDTYSDDFTPFWNATAATSYGSGYQVLLEGKTTFEGQYYIVDTDASGVITSGSGWKTGEQASQQGWESKFNKDLNGDGIIPAVKDDDKDGFVDNVTNYQMFDNGKAITLTDTAGNTYSDASTDLWDAAAAAASGSGYQVLLSGASTYEGQYFVLDTDASGVITKGSGWETGDQMASYGFEAIFQVDLNSDGVI